MLNMNCLILDLKETIVYSWAVSVSVKRVRHLRGQDLHCQCPESWPTGPHSWPPRRLTRLRGGGLQGVAEGGLSHLLRVEVRGHTDIHNVPRERRQGGGGDWQWVVVTLTRFTLKVEGKTLYYLVKTLKHYLCLESL